MDHHHGRAVAFDLDRDALYEHEPFASMTLTKPASSSGVAALRRCPPQRI
jgi:hypothetical protein